MSETIKVRYSVSTDNVGSECTDILEFDKEEWEVMTDDEKEETMKEQAFQHIDWSYEVIE